MTASTARSAPCPWLGVASSPNVMTSCAQSAAKTSDATWQIHLTRRSRYRPRNDKDTDNPFRAQHL